jgi:DNA-directed RNA polymerase subunit RPC12/RpoP
MHWPRIRQNQCPACGHKLQVENEGRRLACAMCFFAISVWDRQQIIRNMNKREKGEEGGAL